MEKGIAIFGSTGSIGKQTLDVIERYPDRFRVEVLTAGQNSNLLIEQAKKFKPDVVVIADMSKHKEVSNALKNLPVKVFAGEKSIEDIATHSNVDMVVSALVGFAGLKPTISAIKAGKHIALANKEVLVVAGQIINQLVKQFKVSLIPVDSEHSAIFQCLIGEADNSIEKLILTASGGPFWAEPLEKFQYITKEDALKHPNWKMGNKITIDSATMMNKGLEVIEAHWLFGVNSDNIEVVIHPQSIIHSLVQFHDGSVKAQLGLPDMRLPIQYALSFPDRIGSDFPRFSFDNYNSLTFEKPDTKKFRNLALAYYALEKGGNMPCVLNAANEIAVSSFLNDTIRFIDIPGVIEQALEEVEFIRDPSFDDLIETDNIIREYTTEYINKRLS